MQDGGRRPARRGLMAGHRGEGNAGPCKGGRLGPADERRAGRLVRIAESRVAEELVPAATRGRAASARVAAPRLGADPGALVESGTSPRDRRDAAAVTPRVRDQGTCRGREDRGVRPLLIEDARGQVSVQSSAPCQRPPLVPPAPPRPPSRPSLLQLPAPLGGDPAPLRQDGRRNFRRGPEAARPLHPAAGGQAGQGAG